MTPSRDNPMSGHLGGQIAIEREQYDLACLFVAQSQLARALDVGGVLAVISEILFNFIGAKRFGIYANDSRSVLRPLPPTGFQLPEFPSQAPMALQLAVERDDSFVATESAVDQRADEPLVAFPLRFAGTSFGGIAVWQFVDRKSAIADVDRRLFEVIAEIGGTALESARVRGHSVRRADSVDHYTGFTSLLNEEKH